MRRNALAAGLLLAAAPALAQDRPPLTPTRDVTVTYRITGDTPRGAPPPMTVSWQAATGTMRTDMPGGMGWMVADTRNGRAFMVMEQMRMVMDIPAAQAQAMSARAGSERATFRREGTATVAGLRCTIWAVQDGDNRGRTCVTDDGVVLRAEGSSQGRSGGMEATQVTFAPQDPARFQRPQGYQTMQMPQGMPPGAMPGLGAGPGAGAGGGLPPGLMRPPGK
jgi:hypothetical protein